MRQAILRWLEGMKRWWRVLIPCPTKWEESFKRRRRPSVSLSVPICLCMWPLINACTRTIPKNQYFSEISPDFD